MANIDENKNINNAEQEISDKDLQDVNGGWLTREAEGKNERFCLLPKNGPESNERMLRQ